MKINLWLTEVKITQADDNLMNNFCEDQNEWRSTEDELTRRLKLQKINLWFSIVKFEMEEWSTTVKSNEWWLL